MEITSNSDAPLGCAEWAVFTDMDATLLDNDSFELGNNAHWIERLLACGIAVVLVTSKTAAEIRHFRQTSELPLAAIVENGGGYMAPDEAVCRPFPWSQSVSELATLVQSVPLIALTSLPADQARQTLGLSGDEFFLAMEREFSVPVLPVAIERCRQQLRDLGLACELGGRIGNVVAQGQSKHQAIEHCRHWLGFKRFVALGDGPNDLSMLKAADWSAQIYNPATASFMNEQISPAFAQP